MPSLSEPWREFAFPLNVFMHVLAHEEDHVSWLHYGLFDHEGESLADAQERSTALLASRLPTPPARVLDVGVGLATTLHRLTAAGYDAEGITPSEQEIAAVRARYGDGVRVHLARFEEFRSGRYDAVFFQESSQYIESDALFDRAAALTPLVIVLDEFALRPLDDDRALPSHDAFVAAARRHGFEIAEEVDLTAQATPTMAYFADRLPAYRDRLIGDLGVTAGQVDDLIESGARYRARYADGTYGYRLVRLAKHRPTGGRLRPAMSASSVNSVRNASPTVAEVSHSRELEVAQERERDAKRRVEALVARLEMAEQQLAVHLAERAQLIAERDGAVARTRDLEDLLAEHQDRLDQLLGSSSWRVTSPMRRLKRKMGD